LIKTCKLEYWGNTRDARKRVAYKVYAEVKGANPPSRFLIRDKQGWVEVTKDKTIIKISQSLSNKWRKPPSKRAIYSSLSGKVNEKDNIIQSKNEVLVPEDNPTLKIKDVINDLSSNNVY